MILFCFECIFEDRKNKKISTKPELVLAVLLPFIEKIVHKSADNFPLRCKVVFFRNSLLEELLDKSKVLVDAEISHLK